MIVETIILSFIIGKLRRGSIKNLAKLNINKSYIFIISFIIEILSLIIITRFNWQLSSILERYFPYIHVLSYLLLILGLVMNYNEKGFRLVLLGTILNFMPIALNKGKMPVSIDALKFSSLYSELKLLKEGRILTHVLENEATKMGILGDIIPIPKPYPLPKIISIGDIFIALGLFVVIQKYMQKD